MYQQWKRYKTQQIGSATSNLAWVSQLNGIKCFIWHGIKRPQVAMHHNWQVFVAFISATFRQ